MVAIWCVLVAFGGDPGPAERAIALYARALLLQRDAELLSAVKAPEEARKLEPDVAAIHKALTQLYLAIDRPEDALIAGKRALELNPDDHETAHLHARQLRNLKRQPEAVAVLARALARMPMRERLDLRAQFALELASVAEEAGDPEKTEAGYRAALAAFEQRETIKTEGKIPERELLALMAETRERLAKTCVQRNKPDEALAHFAEARKLEPERAGRLALLVAGLLEKQNRPAEALRAVDETLGTQPVGLEPVEQKLRLLRAVNRGNEGLAFLEKVASDDAYNLPIQILLGEELVRRGRADRAEAHLEKVFESSPTPEVAAGLLARYKADAANGASRLLTRLDRAIAKGVGKEGDDEEKKVPGDPASAAQARALLVALKRETELTARVLQAGVQMVTGNEKLEYQTRTSLAALASRTRQLALAETLYRSCLRQPGLPMPGGNGEAESYSGLLRVLGYARKHREIVEICKQGLETAQATNRVLFHLELSRAQMALGNKTESLAAADLGVTESNDHSRLLARRNRAVLLAEAGKAGEAISECQALFKEYNRPGEVRDVRYTLSVVHSIGRNLDKSEEQLKLILEADPTDATACNDLGYHYAEENRNLDEAERLVRKAIELDRRDRTSGTEVGVDADHDNAAYLDSLGWVLFRRGKLAEARKELERASRLPGGDDDPVVWDHLGDVLARLDQREPARTAYEKALRLYAAGYRNRNDSAPGEIRKKIQLLQP